ncbi:MAG TPA: glycosyltransferase [Thermoplasmata archaeon]|nr:glycosyltransferase [Thermoplasmata archaeon]
MTDAPAPSVSVVLATLNERPSLPELFDRLERLELPSWEVIVVDDGSTDGTRDLVAARAARDPRYRLVAHDGKQTTVRAQGQGIGAARGRSVVVMDSDLQHPPELVPGMLRSLDAGAALVVASRYLPDGSVGPRSPFRAALSRGAEYGAKLLLPDARRVTDPVSGFFAFRREIYEPLPPGYRGYKLLLFVLGMARGRPVAEVPFRFEPRTEGASKVVSGLGYLRVYLQELLLARRLQYRRAHPTGAPVAAADPRRG